MTDNRYALERPGSFSIRSTPAQSELSVDIEMNGYGSSTRQRNGFTSPTTYPVQGPFHHPNIQEETPKTKFRGRHIQMMGLGTTLTPNQNIGLSYADTLGAAIGSGVLYNSGTPLFLAGPVSLFLAYLWIGTVMYAMMATQK